MSNRKRWNTTRRFTATALGVAAAAAPAAVYAVWEVVPEIELLTETDDNPRLTSDPEFQNSSSRMELDARLRLRSFGERGDAYIEPRVVSEAYGDERNEDLENDDIYLITRADYSWQRVAIGWRSNFREQSILRAEFEEAIPDDPDIVESIETGAGTFGTFGEERRRFDAAFNVDFTLSPRTDMRLQVSHIDVAYSSDAERFFAIDRTDFDDTTISATLSRAVSLRNQVSATVFFSDYSALRNNNDTDAFGVEGSFSRPLSETWAFELVAGVERTDYRFVNDNGVLIDNADASFTFGFDLERQTELTRWDFSFGRFINPNSNGFLSRRNQLRAFVTREFTPRVSGSAGLRYSEVTSADEAQFINDRDYTRASLQLDWAMSERWALTTGVDRISEGFARGDRDATSNSVFVGVRYRGLSR